MLILLLRSEDDGDGMLNVVENVPRGTRSRIKKESTQVLQIDNDDDRSSGGYIFRGQKNKGLEHIEDIRTRFSNYDDNDTAPGEKTFHRSEEVIKGQ